MPIDKVRVNITIEKQVLQKYKNLSKAFYRKFGIRPTISGFVTHEVPRFINMMELMLQHMDRSPTKEQVLDYFLNIWSKSEDEVNKTPSKKI